MNTSNEQEFINAFKTSFAKGTFLNVLIIEDEKIHHMALEDKLKKFFFFHEIPFQINVATTEAQAETMLRAMKYEIAFFDMDLHGQIVGPELLKKHLSQVIYPVVLTFHDSEKLMQIAHENGCRDFLLKPFKEKNLPFLMNRFFTYLHQEKDREFILSRYITQDSTTIKELLQIPLIRTNPNPIYICGATGTGKQVVAETIHNLINKENGKFIEINCSSITETLAESIFFGHKKGSFTNATSDKKGIFYLANGGTLFLDEIGKMPLSLQDILLKVIEQKKFRPIGSEIDVHANFLLITAGLEDLDQLIKEGKFRLDLKERITGTVIKLPSLTERINDIPFLLQHFIRRHSSGRLISIPHDTLNFLKQYWWPGNIRELKILVDRWQAEGVNILTIDDIKKLRSKEIAKVHSYINDDLFEDVKQRGLEDVLEQINSEVINHVFLQNNMKARVAMSKLKIASRKFYKYVQKKITEEENE
ncbi:MAG: sigma-54-dependent Fis family transcriptional regulator [Oligoflexia bacterium]|nr:sigma-54-dependent Fis family transcriptional regulator [Oligoflexia bacterium]